MQEILKLRRFLEPGRRPAAGERCEFCGESLPDNHTHVVNPEQRRLLCVCRACYLLFTHEGAAQGKYRAVPDRYLCLAGMALSDAEWDQLQIPVGMAFVYYNSALGRNVALYPSPAGATESLLPLSAWEEIVQENPQLRTLAPDVEALLVRKGRESFECYLVPIDACYELVGRIRRNWKGFDGGEEARREIDAFFEGVRMRSAA